MAFLPKAIGSRKISMSSDWYLVCFVQISFAEACSTDLYQAVGLSLGVLNERVLGQQL